jgi:hypothetical protein
MRAIMLRRSWHPMHCRAGCMFALIGTATCMGAACAADPGDPLKTPNSPDSGGSAGSSGTVSGAASGSGAATGSGSPSGSGSGSASGSGTSSGSGSGSDAGSGSDVDSGSGSASGSGSGSADVDSAPEVGVGAGCAAGTTVITLTVNAQFNGNTGNFKTLAAVCVQLHGSVHQGWGISNGQGRMVTLISATGTSGPVDASSSSPFPTLPAPQAGSDGFVYWNFTADTANVDYTSIYVF